MKRDEGQERKEEGEGRSKTFKKGITEEESTCLNYLGQEIPFDFSLYLPFKLDCSSCLCSLSLSSSVFLFSFMF